MPSYKKIVLTKHCTGGALCDDLFKVEEDSLPDELCEGQFIVKIEYFSCDPTQRIWATNVPQYMPPVQVGEVMRSLAFGRVVKSANRNFSEGDGVSGLMGWQEYAVLDNSANVSKTPAGVPPEIVLGPCGMTGVTAYFGLFDIGKPVAGDTVVVSGASGATGSAVVQLAKIAGCRVIGIAGGVEKCQQVKDLYGADECIDYKAESVTARLKELTACDYFSMKGGIDVYYDNVGGDILDAALENLAFGGRVVICGAISQYEKLGGKAAPTGPSFYMNLLLRRGTMKGFIILDYINQIPTAVDRISKWIQEGKFKYEVDISEGGIESVYKSVNRLLTGENRGKQLHKLT